MLACHPLPTVVVTAVGAGLAVLAGLMPGRGALVTATVFAGQLSIGWSNDYLDAARDRAVKRRDKPLATGTLEPRIVARAAAAALLATSALSVTLGWPGGAIALLTVISAWGYNLGLKHTIVSWLPYALSFGLAPAVVTLSASPARWPAVWLVVACGLLGVAAHLANVLPDLGDDIATGVRGLPHRMGAHATALTTAALLTTASGVILVGPDGALGAPRWFGFLAAVLVAGWATRLAHRDPSSRTLFVAIVVIAAIDLVALSVAGIGL